MAPGGVCASELDVPVALHGGWPATAARLWQLLVDASQRALGPVLEDQRSRAQPGVLSTRRQQRLPERVLGNPVR